MKNTYHKQVVVVGAGPAGLSVTSELLKYNISVELFESDRSGGKVHIAPRVDNYPNYRSVRGGKLAFDLVNRALDSGVTVTHKPVRNIRKEGNLFYTETDESIITSDVVVVASGTRPRILDVTGVDEFLNEGVYCSAVDNSIFAYDKTVAIIGGGNAALKEAVYLAPKVKKLYLIHRREEFRGLKSTLDELVKMRMDQKNIEILTPFVPEEIIGSDGIVTGLLVKNTKEDYEMKIDVDTVYLSVGQVPNTEIIQIPEVKSESGFIVTDRQMNTSVSGLYAIGDVIDRPIKQIYLSEYDGRIAAESIIKYLDKN